MLSFFSFFKLKCKKTRVFLHFSLKKLWKSSGADYYLALQPCTWAYVAVLHLAMGRMGHTTCDMGCTNVNGPNRAKWGPSQGVGVSRDVTRCSKFSNQMSDFSNETRWKLKFFSDFLNFFLTFCLKSTLFPGKCYIFGQISFEKAVKCSEMGPCARTYAWIARTAGFFIIGA